MAQSNYRQMIVLSLLTSLIMLFMAASVAHATGGIRDAWVALYSTSDSHTNASCQLCHAASTPTLNPYGKAICDQAGTNDQRIAAVEIANSDTDSTGSSNLTEINLSTQPGWTTVAVPTYNPNCTATGSTETAPAGISGSLDPTGGTPTTTLPPTTTTTLPPATTTTTLQPATTTTTLQPAASTTTTTTTTTTTLPTDLCPDDPNKTDPGICGCGRSDADTDSDGIEDCLDNAPYNSNPLQTDSDGDGVGDAAETGDAINDPSVASLLVNYGQDRVTLSTTANNSLGNVATLPTDEMAVLPAGVNFPFDLFAFTITGAGAGNPTTVTITLPAGEAPATYWKYGPEPEPSDTNDHWYEFLYDGTTGAEFNTNVITLHFVDGGRGDDDLTANGIIDDIGGPAIIASGGDSGCFIATAAYGSYWEPHVKTLRQFRDSYLLTSTLGTKFVETYYRYSPPMADYIAEHDSLRSIARIGLAPLVGFSWLAVNYGVIIALAVFLSVLTLVISGTCLAVNKK